MVKPLAQSVSNIRRGLKYNESPIEVMLMNALLESPHFTLVPPGSEPQGEGMFIYPQKEIGPYRADFIIEAKIYHPRHRVWPPKYKGTFCIEADGHVYHLDKEKDTKRDQYFLDQGIKTLRYTGSEIYNNAEFCAQCIYGQIIEELL